MEDFIGSGGSIGATPEVRDYATAAQRLVIALNSGRSIDPSDLQIVQLTLNRLLRATNSRLGEADRADVISDVLTSLLVAVRKGRVDPEQNPGAYIRKATERRAIDFLRRRQRTTLSDETESSIGQSDECLARLLDAEASAQEVEEAMKLLASEGQHRTNQLVGRWLLLAENLQESPSTRQAAERLGTSHDTIARHLALFRDALLKVRAKHEPE